MSTDSQNELAIANQLEASNVTLMKLENETIASLAAAHPRDHKAIKEEIVSQMEAYPSFAESMVYCRPIGSADPSGRQKYARGLSIRAAEALAEAYGFNRIRCEVDEIDEDKVRVTATFTDLQRGRVWQDVGIVSKFYKTRYGKMQRWNDDKFYGMILKGEMSKRVREVILRCISSGLRTELQAMAERYMAKVLSGDGVSKIVDSFNRIGVQVDVLENYIGRPIGVGWTEDDRVTLLSIFNAIKDGQISVAEAFNHKAVTKAPVEEQKTSLEKALESATK
tara:strand:- start:173 stop:1012 length:840 start_codon:yes stop_codon:yes gene_type:complete